MPRGQQPTPDRSTLGFPKAARAAFGFLEREFGFRCVESDGTFVRYESPRVFINVYHGRSSYELQTEIGRLDDTDELESGYTLNELRKTLRPDTSPGGRLALAQTAMEVATEVPRLAMVFRDYAEPALDGNPEIFDSLRRRRIAARREYARQVHLFQIRRQAEEARRAKDWARLVALYEPIIRELSVVEQKRLEYGRKQINLARTLT
jgi:hypothetical protein